MYDYQERVLPNGVRILSKHIPAMSSATLGIWVGTGSRDETAKENGAAHYIEHMLFKGTASHTAAEMAGRMDAIGGQINAFTTKECTCFYARALDTHLYEALDILCGMFFDAKFDPHDVETERGVILEEIGMYSDDPSDLVSERLAAAIYRGTPLARPILGKRSTLEHMDGDWLKAYKAEHYIPSRIIVALAGCFDDAVVEEIAARFAAMEEKPAFRTQKAAFRSGEVTLKKKATEQNHLILAFPSLDDLDPRRFVLQVLGNILGGGMSSRLFQEIREQRGLCYNIYSYGSSYLDTGFYGIYTAVNREQERPAIAAIRETVERFTSDGVTQEELDRARELSKANVLMGMESGSAHMNHMARAALRGERPMSTDEIIDAYNAVTREQIRALAEETFRWDAVSFSAVGKVAAEDAYRAALGATTPSAL